MGGGGGYWLTLVGAGWTRGAHPVHVKQPAIACQPKTTHIFYQIALSGAFWLIALGINCFVALCANFKTPAIPHTQIFFGNKPMVSDGRCRLPMSAFAVSHSLAESRHDHVPLPLPALRPLQAHTCCGRMRHY